MKILLLNHHIDAQHKISARLQAAGAVLLIPSHAEEAWKMLELHGQSLDLAVIHREGLSEGQADGAADEGEKLIARIKADPAQSDLAIILTSSLWGEVEFFQHQQSPMGVNAYLHWPFTDDELVETIEAMFGNSIRFAAATATGTNSKFNLAPAKAPAEPASPISFAGMEVKLEEASNVSLEPPPQSPVLEMPSLSLEPPQDFALEIAPDAGSSPAPVLADPSSPDSAAAPAASIEPAVSGEPALPDLSDGQQLEHSLLGELEPYERLEIDQRIKLSQASPQLEIQSDASAIESGTTVLDPAAMGLQMTESQPQVELGSAPMATPPVQESTNLGVDEEELSSELPYLFSKKNFGASEAATGAGSSALVFSEPVGDAVIPGGAVQSPDSETLKKYLMLREQDVAILSNQLKSARNQIAQMEKRLREEIGKAGDLEHAVAEQQKRIEEFEQEKALALQGLQGEIDELRFQNKTKTDKARLLEAKVTEATEEIERLKVRVRTDIRKIRVREKELENKLEIVRKDSEALITARESKIMELKRKIDLLEFNIDLLQDQNAREKENSAQLRERLAKAAQVVRVAGGLLDSQGKAIIEESAPEKKASREAS